MSAIFDLLRRFGRPALEPSQDLDGPGLLSGPPPQPAAPPRGPLAPPARPASLLPKSEAAPPPADISDRGVRFLIRSEGRRLSAYQDTGRNATIGYGHKIRPGERFSKDFDEAQAQSLLKADLAEARDAVSRIVKAPLTQPQRDALISFTYNAGAGSLAKWTRHLAQGPQEAADALLGFAGVRDKATGKLAQDPGVLARRKRERDLFLNGVYGDEPARAKQQSGPQP